MMSVLLSSMKWLLQGHHVARLLGLFLLVTAGLKIHGLVVDPYGQENFLALPWLQVLTIEVEVLLGLWLLSGVQLRWALITSLLLFSVFACLSFTLAWQGQTDCGCFGKLKVNPWWTFGLDLGLTAIIACCLVKRNLHEAVNAEQTSFLYSSVHVTVIAIIILGSLLVSITIIYGDLRIAIAKFRGESLIVVPGVVDLGEGISGEVRTFSIKLINLGNQTINIVGGTATCACVTTADLPIAIQGLQEDTIRISIKFSGTAGAFSHRYVLYRDGDVPITISYFSGKVVSQSASNGSLTNPKQIVPDSQALDAGK